MVEQRPTKPEVVGSTPIADVFFALSWRSVNTYYNWCMGKKTTVKLTVQQKKEQKEHMKKVMQELANNQKINGERVKQLTSVTDIHLTANKHKHTGLKHRKLPKKQ